MTKPNADKLWLTPNAPERIYLSVRKDRDGNRDVKWFGNRTSEHDVEYVITRPAPRVGDDVVEAMADAHYQAGIDSRPKPKMDSRFQMQQALKAAEAMGYTLTPSERVLPELPEGWEFAVQLSSKDPEVICQSYLSEGDDNLISFFEVRGPTPRAAVLAAIAKIAPPAGEMR